MAAVVFLWFRARWSCEGSGLLPMTCGVWLNDETSMQACLMRARGNLWLCFGIHSACDLLRAVRFIFPRKNLFVVVSLLL